TTSVWDWPQRPAVQSSSFSHSHVLEFHSPGAHATGRWLSKSNGMCQARHSSSFHASATLPAEVWMPGMPLESTQFSSVAQILVMPPVRLATATCPDRLTEVRDGLPCRSGRV